LLAELTATSKELATIMGIDATPTFPVSPKSRIERYGDRARVYFDEAGGTKNAKDFLPLVEIAGRWFLDIPAMVAMTEEEEKAKASE
jgi:hypothetical protein